MTNTSTTQTETTLCDTQNTAQRLHEALTDLTRDCKARLCRPGLKPAADLRGFKLS